MSFSAADILEFAMRIEENGANFYRYAVQITKDEEAKQIFDHLADEELNHQKIFGRIFASIAKTAPPESYAGEYSAYLRNYVDNAIIFTKAALDQELAAVKDTPTALDFAMRREMDSILYYHEIKQVVPASEHAEIDQVIAEERRHYSKLSEIKKKYQK